MVWQGLWGLKPLHSFWAHRLKTHLSTGFLPWLKRQLSLEAPQACPSPPTELPSHLLLQQPVVSPKRYK